MSKHINQSRGKLSHAMILDPKFLFLDPIGSLVSTLWVGGLLVGYTFSKLVNFECCSVVMMEC